MTTYTAVLGLPKPEGTDLISQGFDAIADLADALETKLATGDKAWTPYAVAWTVNSGTNPVLGNGTLFGRYWRIGRRVGYRINLTFGSTTTLGSGVYQFTVPVPMANLAVNAPAGRLSALDVSASARFFRGVIPLSSTNVCGITEGGVYLTNASPVVWANGDHIGIAGTYEALDD